jgi:hypothetical protein
VKKTTTPKDGSQIEFVNQHREEVTGVLSGFDRLRILGSLRCLNHVPGMRGYLNRVGVLLKCFKAHVLEISDRVKAATHALSCSQNRPIQYLRSSQCRKDELVREIARRDGVQNGLITILSVVEPCLSYSVRGQRQTQKLELVHGPSKCLHYYYYYFHPEVGFMHMRLQTWFPFTIHMCLNGREWLARQMENAGLGFVRKDNCFIALSDVAQTQQLMDQQLRTRWPKLLEEIMRANHPVYAEVFEPLQLHYYWSISESEYATDIMFRHPQSLARFYPQLVRQGICTFSSADVLKFLGHKVTPSGQVTGQFKGEVLSDLRQRWEGVRLKHRVKNNSIKLYDKHGSVLRVETTLRSTRDFKVYRKKEGDPQSEKRWRILRRGVADLKRRADLSHRSNLNYLAGLAALGHKEPAGELVQQICQRRKHNGRSFRALNPWSPEDRLLLEAVNRGEFAINGLRNADLRALLFPQAKTEEQRRNASGKISRKLRLLREHGLLTKVPGTHLYRVTAQGRKIITAIINAYHATVEQLAMAA